jgi:hypothetical protein
VVKLPEFTWVCECGRKITAYVADAERVRCRECDRLYDYEAIKRVAQEIPQTNQVEGKEANRNAAAIAAVAIIIGAPSVFVSPIFGFALIVGGIAGAAVYDDAYKRRDPAPIAWALGTWLLLIIVLPLYLYHRAYGLITE